MSGPYGVTSLTVIVPGTPTRAQSPNGRVHHMARYRANEAMKRNARLAAVSVRNTVGGGPIFDGPVTVQITIGWERGRQTNDGDNALASCKAAIDGLTAAGIWRDDRDCTFLPVVQVRDPEKRGYIRFDVTEAAA